MVNPGAFTSKLNFYGKTTIRKTELFKNTFKNYFSVSVILFQTNTSVDPVKYTDVNKYTLASSLIPIPNISTNRRNSRRVSFLDFIIAKYIIFDNLDTIYPLMLGNFL